MISYHNGDLLESGCDWICHQCNLQSIFGGGIAYQIAQKYKGVEEFCKRVGAEYVGDFIPYVDKATGQTIANCYSQEPNFDTNYEAIKEIFTDIRNDLITNIKLQPRVPVKVGVPFKYGCGIANGDWEKVEQIFKDIFENEKDIDFQIWKLEA